MSKLASMFDRVDMTEGSPVKKIVAFSIPMLLGNIAQQLYSTVDSVVVGKYVGDNALAAVGSATPVLFLLFALFIGVATGVSIVVAQYVGAKNREDLSKSICSGLLLAVATAVVIMIIGPLITRPLLKLLNTPESISEWCAKYLIIIFVGFIGNSVYNISMGILRGLGDSVSALIYLCVSTVLNIALDLLFVAGIKMEGVSGVALATVIAQWVSAVLCLIKLTKMKDFFDFKLKYFRFTKRYSMEIIKLGLPSGLTQMIFSAASVVVQTLTNSFGEMVIAANVIVMRVDGFVMMPNFTFGAALTTYVGQNIGARKMDRIKEGVRKGTWLAVGVISFLVVLMLFCGKYLMMIFTDTDELVTLSNHCMRLLAIGYIGSAVSQCLQGAMRGAGETVAPMWISLVTTVIIRVPVAYLIQYLTISPEMPNGSYTCIFISLMISWLLGGVITYIAYKMKKWRKRVGLL